MKTVCVLCTMMTYEFSHVFQTSQSVCIAYVCFITWNILYICMIVTYTFAIKNIVFDYYLYPFLYDYVGKQAYCPRTYQPLGVICVSTYTITVVFIHLQHQNPRPFQKLWSLTTLTTRKHHYFRAVLISCDFCTSKV